MQLSSNPMYLFRKFFFVCVVQSPIHISTHMVFCVPAYGSIGAEIDGKKRRNPCTYFRKLSQIQQQHVAACWFLQQSQRCGWTATEKKKRLRFSQSAKCVFVILASFSHTCAQESTKRIKWNFLFLFMFRVCVSGRIVCVCRSLYIIEKWRKFNACTHNKAISRMWNCVYCADMSSHFEKFRWLRNWQCVFSFCLFAIQLENNAAHILAACVNVCMWLHMKVGPENHYYIIIINIIVIIILLFTIAERSMHEAREIRFGRMQNEIDDRQRKKSQRAGAKASRKKNIKRM